MDGGEGDLGPFCFPKDVCYKVGIVKGTLNKCNMELLSQATSHRRITQIQGPIMRRWVTANVRSGLLGDLCPSCHLEYGSFDPFIVHSIELKSRQVDYTQAFPQADLADPVYMRLLQGWFIAPDGTLT